MLLRLHLEAEATVQIPPFVSESLQTLYIAWIMRAVNMTSSKIDAPAGYILSVGGLEMSEMC